MIDKNKLKKIKLIVSDLDGTLLNHQALISDETKKLIFELKERGVQFSFASGRLHSALTHLAEELDIQIPLISLDGSMIKSHPEGEIIYESFVKDKYIKKAIYFADKFLLNLALCHADAIYYTESNSIIPRIMDKFGAKYEEVRSYENCDKETLEIVFASDYNDNLKYVKNKMSFPHSIGLSSSYFKSQNHEGIYYLELRRQGSSKGMGLIKLLKYLKIKPQESAIIGDWYNDVSLFETESVKIALANSVSEIKRMADLVMQKSNDQDGVAEFLELVLKAKKDKY
ncbi:MAG: Cof-type HAD-IIB family hydrolase [Ignavibacteriaceae bacterium]